MTLAEYRTVVRGLLTDDQYDATLIDQALNWFVYELFNDTRTRLMESSDLVSALANSSTADYPDDLLTIIGIYVTAPRVFQLNDAMEYKSFMRNYADFATATAREVSAWVPYGGQMRFSAPLKTATTFQIDYLRIPTPMENDSDDCEVPDNYSELVAKGALARIMEINEDYSEAEQERELLAPLLTTFKRNEGRGGGKTGPASIMRTNRRRNGGTGNPFEDGLRG